MSSDLNLKETLKEWHGSLRSYVIGLTCSLILTSASFLLVSNEWMSGAQLVVTLIGLALVQAIVQLIFFLHVGQEPKPKWETLVFYFMVLILFIIVIGSLWIIHDLNERTMMEMEQTYD